MPALNTIGSVMTPTTSRPPPSAPTAGHMLLPGAGCAAGDDVVASGCIDADVAVADEEVDAGERTRAATVALISPTMAVQ